MREVWITTAQQVHFGFMPEAVDGSDGVVLTQATATVVDPLTGTTRAGDKLSEVIVQPVEDYIGDITGVLTFAWECGTGTKTVDVPYVIHVGSLDEVFARVHDSIRAGEPYPE